MHRWLSMVVSRIGEWRVGAQKSSYAMLALLCFAAVAGAGWCLSFASAPQVGSRRFRGTAVPDLDLVYHADLDLDLYSCVLSCRSKSRSRLGAL